MYRLAWRSKRRRAFLASFGTKEPSILLSIRAHWRRPPLADRRRSGISIVNAMPAPRPYTLIAEITYRCPLACPYCSNPIHLDRHRSELSTEQWKVVLTDAEALGV